MPWDAVNIGNHELYKNSTIEFITRPNGFVDFWEGKYLTSNVLDEKGSPIGERYRYLYAPFSNKTILTFGFLYNFQRNCLMTTVESVEKVVNSTWFNDVLLEDKFDAILVLAHMGYSDPLVDVILARIRQVCGDDMPVQFITGHTHIRANQQLDYYSSSFEAGRFLDTVGLVSFPTKKKLIPPGPNITSIPNNSTNLTNTSYPSIVTSHTPSTYPSTNPSSYPSLNPSSYPSSNPSSFPSLYPSSDPSSDPSSYPSLHPSLQSSSNISWYPSSFPSLAPSISLSPSFSPSISPSPSVALSDQPSIRLNDEFIHTFIDTSVNNMKNLVGVDVLRTKNGTELSNFIRGTQEKLGLFEILGYSPDTFYEKKDMQKSDSLWGLFLKEVVPNELLSLYSGKNIFIQNSGAFRYDLFAGNVTLNDLVSTSPFNDTIFVVDDKVKGDDIIKALGQPNAFFDDFPYLGFAGVEDFNLNHTYRVFVSDFSVGYVTTMLMNVTNRKLSPKKLDDISTSLLWTRYINSTWACPEKKNEEEEPRDFLKDFFEFFRDYTALKVVAFILSFVIVVFFGWMFVCRSHKTSMFPYSDSESGSELSISEDEFSSSEASQSSSVYMPKRTPPLNQSSKRISYNSFYPSNYGH